MTDKSEKINMQIEYLLDEIKPGMDEINFISIDAIKTVLMHTYDEVHCDYLIDEMKQIDAQCTQQSRELCDIALCYNQSEMQ